MEGGAGGGGVEVVNGYCLVCSATYAVLGVGDLDPLCLCLVESSDWYQSHLSVSPSKNYDQLLLL